MEGFINIVSKHSNNLFKQWILATGLATSWAIEEQWFLFFCYVLYRSESKLSKFYVKKHIGPWIVVVSCRSQCRQALMKNWYPFLRAIKTITYFFYVYGWATIHVSHFLLVHFSHKRVVACNLWALSVL